MVPHEEGVAYFIEAPYLPGGARYALEGLYHKRIEILLPGSAIQPVGSAQVKPSARKPSRHRPRGFRHSAGNTDSGPRM